MIGGIYHAAQKTCKKVSEKSLTPSRRDAKILIKAQQILIEKPIFLSLCELFQRIPCAFAPLRYCWVVFRHSLKQMLSPILRAFPSSAWDYFGKSYGGESGYLSMTGKTLKDSG
jgi:hypothetical protein